MINDMKNLFLLSIFTISFVIIADNPGDIVVSEEPEAATEEVVEDAPIETESESSEEEVPAESDDGVVTLEKVTVIGGFTQKLVDFNKMTAEKVGFTAPFLYYPLISGYSKNLK